MKYFIFVIFTLFSISSYANCSTSYINSAYKVAYEAQKTSDHDVVSEIPLSIVVAQNILESGCGKSRVANKKKNYYGLIGRNNKYLEFQDIEHSTEYYFENLATNNAYSSFRSSVSKKHSIGKIIKKLSNVYAEDPKYSKKLLAVISSYNLRKFDK